MFDLEKLLSDSCDDTNVYRRCQEAMQTMTEDEIAQAIIDCKKRICESYLRKLKDSTYLLGFSDEAELALLALQRKNPDDLLSIRPALSRPFILYTLQAGVLQYHTNDESYCPDGYVVLSEDIMYMQFFPLPRAKKFRSADAYLNYLMENSAPQEEYDEQAVDDVVDAMDYMREHTPSLFVQFCNDMEWQMEEYLCEELDRMSSIRFGLGSLLALKCEEMARYLPPKMISRICKKYEERLLHELVYAEHSAYCSLSASREKKVRLLYQKKTAATRSIPWKSSSTRCNGSRTIISRACGSGISGRSRGTRPCAKPGIPASCNSQKMKSMAL